MLAASFLHGPRARAAAGIVVIAAIAAGSPGRAASGLADPAGPRAVATGPGGPVAQPVPPGPLRVTAPGPCAEMRLRLRCPDLVMSAPAELHLDGGTIPGHVLLRATSSINNHGPGPLEISAHRNGAHGWVTYQAIYGRSGRRHLFPSAARLVFKYVPGQRYEYGDVGAATYWKLEHAAAFQLWSLDARFRAVRLVRTGPKVDYCLRDLLHTRPSAFSPSAPRYAACRQDPYLRRDVLGTSSGWSDVYPYEYPQQWIDVTGLYGRFAYVQIADPNGVLIERNHRNDISETYVALPSGRVLGHRVGVAEP